MSGHFPYNLSDNNIEKLIPDRFVRSKGKEALETGSVLSVEEVQKDHFRFYIYDSHNRLLDLFFHERSPDSAVHFSCSCPAYYQNHHCYHIACALYFLQNLQNFPADSLEESFDLAIQDQKEKARDHNLQLYFNRLRDIVRSSVVEERERYIKSMEKECKLFKEERADLRVRYELSLQAELSPDLFQNSKDKYALMLRLKFGLKNIYLARDLEEVLRLVLREKQSQNFGKRFSYDPKEHQLSSQDQKIWELLLQIYDEEKTEKAGQKSSSSSDKDRLLIPSYALPQLLQYLSEVPELSFKYEAGNSEAFLLEKQSQYTEDYKQIYYHKGSVYPFPIQYQLELENDEAVLLRNSSKPDFISPELLQKAAKNITAVEDILPLLYESSLLFIGPNIYQLDPAFISAIKSLDGLWIFEQMRRSTAPQSPGILDASLQRSIVSWQQDFILKQGSQEQGQLLKISDKILELHALPLPNPELYLDVAGDMYTAQLYPFGKAQENQYQESAENLALRRINFLFQESFNDWEQKDNKAWTDHLDTAANFLFGRLPKLQEENLFTIFVSDSLGKEIYRKTRLPRGIARMTEDKIPLLEINFDEPDLSLEEMKEIWQEMLAGARYTKLSGGRLIDLQDPALDALKQLDEAGFSPDQLSAHVQIPLYRSLTAFSEETPLQFEESLVHFFDKIRQLKKTCFPWPEGIEAKPFPYQLSGYRWLKELDELSFSAVLADDMGLGKTLQIIALLYSVKDKENLASLVICPSSVLYNWQRECQRFAPQLKLSLITGSKTEREEKIRTAREDGSHVLITSYPLLSRDGEIYQEYQWGRLVLDESQTVKNKHTQAHQILKTLNCRNIFALSGTPLENRLEELYNLFHLLLPGLLGSPKEFRELSAETISSRIAPFILRRLKKDVLQDLPEKTEEVILIDLTESQKKLYLTQVQEVRVGFREVVKAGRLSREKLRILAGLTRLRQLCCDPRLLGDGIQELPGDPLEHSAKLDFLLDYLEEAMANQHRVVLFSQFTSMLALIREALDKRSYEYFYLDGSTPLDKRLEYCQRFNHGEGSLFLLSMRAGGTGLNLTGGDLVILYDSWWNPAIEDQAADRVYRLGQSKAVHVVRLITQGTIEEHLAELQEKKRDLIDAVIHKGGLSLSSLSQEEIEQLLRS